jgi:GGDEF domain-containing protein
MNIAYLRVSEQSPEAVSAAGHTVTTILKHDALTRDPDAFDGVLIGGHDPKAVEEAALRLRASAPLSASPVVLLQEPGERALSLLADGVARDGAAAAALMAPVQARLKSLPPDILSQGQNFRLLAYLFCRPETVLTPLRRWDSQPIYAYPAAEMLADADTNVDQWLANLVERGYLEPAALVDRLRLCPACGGMHHNFVDVCPICKSIDILQKPFLHCFTCGNVGPEEEFLSGGALTCPKCATRLRHIGADYDRPLENQSCNGCRQSFIDAEVLARCMHCGAENPPERLVPRPVYSFRLAERGRTAARTGNLEDIYALFDHLNYVRPQFFIDLVDWLLAVCRRHSDERFSLLGIRLSNVVELSANIGRHRTAELVDEFATRLRETVRKTDLTTRMDQRTLWILLPKTECPACTLLLGRIEEIRGDSRQAEGAELHFDTVSYSAPAEQQTGETAELLLARLVGELG